MARLWWHKRRTGRTAQLDRSKAKSLILGPDNLSKRTPDCKGTRLRSPEWGRRFHMPTSKELTIRLENQPGILGKCCKTLAARGVNILAFQAVPSQETAWFAW